MWTDFKPPGGEQIRTVYGDQKDNVFFVVTWKPSFGTYYLYENQEGKFVRLGKSYSPIDLEKKYNIDKRLGYDE